MLNGFTIFSITSSYTEANQIFTKLAKRIPPVFSEFVTALNKSTEKKLSKTKRNFSIFSQRNYNSAEKKNEEKKNKNCLEGRQLSEIQTEAGEKIVFSIRASKIREKYPSLAVPI